MKTKLDKSDFIYMIEELLLHNETVGSLPSKKWARYKWDVVLPVIDILFTEVRGKEKYNKYKIVDVPDLPGRRAVLQGEKHD